MLDIDPETGRPWPQFQPGDQVRVTGRPIGATLTNSTGRIARADPRYAGYYVVALDEPAREWHSGNPLPEIVVAAFNLAYEEQQPTAVLATTP